MAKTIDALPVPGARLATAAAGLRYRGRDDVALIELCESAVTAAVFTRNRFKAAPVVVAQEHLSRAAPRYLLVNAGIANAGVGAQGVADAKHCCETLAAQAGVATETVLPFSTGVIGQRLPTDKMKNVIPALLQTLSEDACEVGWEDAARAIMTTDTVPKVATRLCGEADSPVTITGIAKGAGMICPDMATMLAFVATDVELDAAAQNLLAETCATSFNAITVDGDTSSNDACVLVATGRSGVALSAMGERRREAFERALSEVMQELAQAIVRDAEGASRFVTIEVEGAADVRAARAVAMTVANSPLVKTALSAGDPNWGRILAAIGRAPTEVVIEDVDLYFGGDGEVQVVAEGALASAYEEARGVAALGGHDVMIRIVLNAGTATARVWTSDLTADYVRINADYRN